MRTDTSTVQREFVEAMRRRNLALSDDLTADGKKHRCDATNKENGHGKGDGKYVLYLDNIPAGGFINYTDGHGWENWCSKSKHNHLTDADRRDLFRKIEADKAEAEAEQKRRWERAADEASHMWDEGKAPHPEQWYLYRKRIEPHGVRATARTKNANLIVPLLYGPGHDIWSVQTIGPKGDKYFLKGGRVRGCYFRLGKQSEARDNDTVCLCEGFSTAASVRQATGHVSYVAFNAGNLVAVAKMVRRRHPKARIVVCADDDWRTEGNPGLSRAKQAAVEVDGFVAIPDFGDDRRDNETDFNDMACVFNAADIKRLIDHATNVKEPPPMTREERERLVDEFAKLDPIEVDYGAEREATAKALGMKFSDLDKLVKQRRKEKGREKPAAAAKPDEKKLAGSAREMINSKNVLGLFIDDLSAKIAGEERNAKLLYLVITSRLFDDTMHAVVKGASAVGKTELMNSVLAFMPPEDVISFTTLSDKALFFCKDDFKHKILAMGEVIGGKDQELKDSVMRQLMSEKRLSHLMVVKIGDDFETKLVEKEGPVVFLITTTRTVIHQENETRVLSLEADDSTAQTRRVLHKIAITKGLNKVVNVDFRPWHDFQRWLAAGPREVVVPFADVLYEMIPAKSVRLRRDFPQVLGAIKAHALLHQEHRKRDKRRQIVATIVDDYTEVRALMATVLAEASEARVRKTIVETVEAVEELQPPGKELGAMTIHIARKLKLDRSVTLRRLRKAEELGLITNLETRHRQSGRYRTTDHEMDAVRMLPDPDELRERYNDHRSIPPEKSAQGAQGRTFAGETNR